MPEDDDQRLRAALPERAAARVRSLRLANGVASVVLDGDGLVEAERAALERDAHAALAARPEVAEARVAMLAERAPPRPAPRIVAVASGKGGVGKSTLAANLAVALARGGRKVGLVDADIHGPSQPRLMGSERERPRARGGKLVPVAGRWGVPLLSIGHLADPGRAIAWRGPMAANALARLIDADWADAELLIADLPPGSGDVQLTLLKRFPPAGAVIVSTPQDLALIDARRAAELFAGADVPLIGLVENMAGYACPHCGELSEPFGAGGAEAEARALGVPFLGRVPLDPEVRRASDTGTPPAAGEGAHAQAFGAIAARLAAWLDGAPA